jgi:hypothetical protein
LREKRKRTFWEPHKGKGEKKTRSMFSSPHFFSLPEKKSFSCTIFLCVYIYIHVISLYVIIIIILPRPKSCARNVKKISEKFLSIKHQYSSSFSVPFGVGNSFWTEGALTNSNQWC